MLTAKTSKRLQMLNKPARDFLCSWTQSRDFYAQAQLQETSKQTELQRKMFDVEHLIYNQWCSQYKSDTNS